LVQTFSRTQSATFFYFFFRYDVPEGDRSERVSEADEGQTGAGRGILAGSKISFKIKRTDKVRVADSDLMKLDASFYLTIHTGFM
jgi:hypothetical protein